MTLHPSTWAFPADCNAREGAGGATRAGGRVRERQELPGLPWKLSSQIVQVARNDGRIAGQAIGGSAWAIELGEHSPDLGNRSASRRVAIASSSRARRVVFVCVLDGEPTCPAGWSCRGPAHLVDVVPNPWKSVLSAVDVESGAAKPHHASKQTELGRGGGVWASCSAIWWGTGECDFQERT